MNPNIAESTSILLVKVNAALDAQLANIQRQCQPEEFELQRRLFGATMAGLLDILNPIYREHPSLKPTQMGGSYVLPNIAQSVAQLVNAA